MYYMNHYAVIMDNELDLYLLPKMNGQARELNEKSKRNIFHT